MVGVCGKKGVFPTLPRKGTGGSSEISAVEKEWPLGFRSQLHVLGALSGDIPHNVLTHGHEK